MDNKEQPMEISSGSLSISRMDNDSGYTTCPNVDETPDKPFSNQISTSTPRFTDFISKNHLLWPKHLLVTPVKNGSLRNKVYKRNDIGELIGEEHVDFITRLEEYDCSHYLLKYLSSQSLHFSYQVSKSWRSVIINCKLANARRLNYIKTEKKSLSEKPIPYHRNVPRVVLSNISNSQEYKPQTKANISQFELYTKEVQKLLACERLLHCPRCNHPARITPPEDRGRCTNKNCDFNFCSRCKLSFHWPDLCPVRCRGKPERANSIGSTNCKRNLRRL